MNADKRGMRAALYDMFRQSGLGCNDFYRGNQTAMQAAGFGTLNSWIGYQWRARKKSTRVDNYIEASLQFPQELKLQECMIIGDVHLPTLDLDMFAKMLQVADKHLAKPRTLIIAGDLINNDAFSNYDPDSPPPTFDSETKAARAFLADCLEIFDGIYYFLGNHERRTQKRTKGAITPEMLADLINVDDTRIRTSRYGWVNVDCAGVPYRITHARNYSINQLNVADKLAIKYKRHIISHHEHHTAIGRTRYGGYVIVNNGGLFNRDALEYTLLDDSTSAVMKPGFTMLKNGTPYLFGEHPLTDWTMWLS